MGAVVQVRHETHLGLRMASSQGVAARRRGEIAASALLALVSSAAKRRAHDLALDDREREAVTKTQTLLRSFAEELRDHWRPSSDSTYATWTHAFVALAAPGARAARSDSSPEDQADAVEGVADRLDRVLDESLPLSMKDSEDLVALFGALSGTLLSRIARAGETVGGRTA
ncbi:hypothetical protein L2K70_11240 [Nocardioides KLBMP 9356]|uniref:SAV-6107-like HEPN domain-containing protein n=1 Tax=Nocardioides potassii TaxID=2911371 RepID=A0ABS9HCZ9_9ACTN|nr:hypothetical protein [Nocardioides potassii]MCF6378177.1 hypothetical protein [Nocardioides potassii]